MAGPEPTSAAAATSAIDEGNTISPCACCADDPVADLEAMQSMANELQRPPTNPVGRNSEAQELSLIQRDTTLQPNATTGSGVEASDDGGNVDGSSSSGSGDEEAEAIKRKEDEAKLMRMSINTAIAIGLHNFPEGLATFVAALHDPKVGAVLALAIAIHNVPEGLCVALPIYYATGKRWKAFGLAVCSGASEPVAALLGWAVLANSFSNTMYAVLFGLVAGMMVIISVRELLPTAHRYDPDDSVVTYSYIVGMCIMALSLVLFVL
jgi:zinc transporter ZupT